MISNLEPSSELFLAAVDRIRQRIAEANRQVSSGKRISTAADAPDEIDAVLQLRTDQQRIEQIQSNLAVALANAQGADGALTSAIKLMDRARVLAAEGASDLADPTSRKSLAGEAQSLLEEMVSFSRTTVQGCYLFSGDLDSAPTYIADPASATGATQLQNPAATRRIENPAGGSFAATRSAQDIFDSRDSTGAPAADNVFAALNSLQAALASGDAAAVTQCAGSIQAASERLNASQAFYGTVENRIQDAKDFGGRYTTELKTQLSDKEDADVAAAALELQRGNTQMQAAFQMRAAMPRKSLFDYLG